MGKRIFKIFLIQLIILSIIFFYFYYNNIYNRIETVDTPRKAANEEDSRELSSNNTDMYEELERALLNGEKRITVKNKEPKEIFNILEKIVLTNPKVMYYDGGEYSLEELSISYSMDIENMKKHQNEIDIIREQFIKENIREAMSDYEKILKVHDYIILNSRYDESLEIYGSVPPESNSSYGILALGVGVCDGYAKAMKYLLDGIDIKSEIVVGKAKGENHAWNLVNIHGEYYHIDPTWNDPVTSDGSQILRYNYFNLTDDEISKSHSWDRERYPIANGNTYNYFNYNGLVVVGKKGLEDRLKETLFSKKKVFSGKILDFGYMGINLDKIIGEIIQNDQDSINLKSYSYSLDEEQAIVSFEFSYY